MEISSVPALKTSHKIQVFCTSCSSSSWALTSHRHRPHSQKGSISLVQRLIGTNQQRAKKKKQKTVSYTTGYKEAPTPAAHLWNLQSEAIWPAPPHLVHTVVLVMLRVSELCQGLKILSRKKTHTHKKRQSHLKSHGQAPYSHRFFRSECTLPPFKTDATPVIILSKGPIQTGQLPKLHLP